MKNKSAALFLMYDGLTDPLGQSQVLPYLKELSRNYSFDVIGFEKKEIFELQKEEIIKKIGNSDINWIPISYTKNPPILSSVYDFFRAWLKAKKNAKQKSYDLIHCRSSAIGLVALAIRRRCKSKLIFDMRGWWADEKRESGAWKFPLYFPIYKYFKRIEKRLFEESNYCISLTHSGFEEIVSKSFKTSDQVAVIPTCVDFDSFKPFDEYIRNESRKELQIKKKDLVLLYSGSLGGNYSMDVIFGLYKAFKKDNEDTKILFLTPTDPDFIKGEISKENIPHNDIRIHSSSYKDVYKYLMAGDFGLINYSKTYSTIGRSPTKLGEYWACGLPVISQSEIGDIDFLVNKYPNSGYLIDNLNMKSFDSAIDRLKAMSFSKTKLREYSIDYYDLKKGAESYQKIYKKILD